MQTPIELMKSKIGTCWDQVELERYLFKKENIKVNTYFICTYDGNNLPSHTFLTFLKEDNVYWLENSWGLFKGIHKYVNIDKLLSDVKEKFINSHRHEVNEGSVTRIYLYDNPKFHINVVEFYDFIEREGILVNS